MNWKTHRLLADAQMALGCVATVATIIVLWKVASPNGARMARMKLLKTGEIICMDSAMVFANLADGFSKAYDKSRMVTL